MKRVYSGCVTKIGEEKESIEGAIDYSELSENILTNQIKVDLDKIKRYAEKASKSIGSTVSGESYDLFWVIKDYVEEVADCFDALYKKMG